MLLNSDRLTRVPDSRPLPELAIHAVEQAPQLTGPFDPEVNLRARERSAPPRRKRLSPSHIAPPDHSPQ
jgi:hypothetical protein